MKLLPIFFLLPLFACKNDKDEKIHLPSQVYHFVKIDTAALVNKHAVYVPVYSHIYTGDGTSALNLSATLSIRNTSYTDSFYVTDVIYYGSQGEVLKHYIDAAVLVKPMASIEFVVERMETKGGAGANFVVKWGAAAIGCEPLIQAVMNELGAGISFVTNGVEMK
jgi:hypothetical protein